jgi:hypothetical protein
VIRGKKRGEKQKWLKIIVERTKVIEAKRGEVRRKGA